MAQADETRDDQNEREGTSERDLEDALIALFRGWAEDLDFPLVARATSFEEAGLLTRHRGVVLRLRDGAAFQITIVEDRPAR